MEGHGVLVGWRGQNLGDRTVLTIESFGSADEEKNERPDEFYLLMNTQQAAVLGNYLVELSGQTPVEESERSWFKRLFG